jgi:biotin transport system substrate-specific component
MTGAVATARPRVLADLVPGRLVRDALLVVGTAALTGLVAQVSIPLVPVPITMQTFTVLLAGAALGPLRGGASMLLYLALGAVGVPWFAEQASGLAIPTFGYIVGFVVAAAVVGTFARRGADRTVSGTAAIMVLGNLIIYAVGVPWLIASLNVDLATGLGYGLWPFLIGDGLKVALAAAVLPGAWRLVGNRVSGG